MMNRNLQRGFSLIAALVFMVVLTIIGISVVGNTTNEEKMARNFRDRDIAYAAAEAALRDAEMRINGKWRWPNADPIDFFNFDTSCTDGLCDARLVALSPSAHQADFFASSVASTTAPFGFVTGSPRVQGVSAQPRYRIELVMASSPNSQTQSTARDKTAYRITAQARGQMAVTRVTLQEVYRPASN